MARAVVIAPTLRTARLRLTAPATSHFEDYAAAWADPVMTARLGGPRDRALAWTRFTQMAGLWPLLGHGYWSVLDPAGGFLGVAGLGRFERGIPALGDAPEAGWALVPAAWGAGLATEAMTAVLAWADDRLDAPQTRCLISPGHVASHRVAVKLGYRPMAGADPADGAAGDVVYRRVRRGV